MKDNLHMCRRVLPVDGFPIVAAAQAHIAQAVARQNTRCVHTLMQVRHLANEYVQVWFTVVCATDLIV